MRYYIGERYVAQADGEVALVQAERVRAAVLRIAQQGEPVRLLSTTFVPHEEWVFDLFEAETVEQVRRVYAVGDVPVERVTESVHLPGP